MDGPGGPLGLEESCEEGFLMNSCLIIILLVSEDSFLNQMEPS